MKMRNKLILFLCIGCAVSFYLCYNFYFANIPADGARGKNIPTAKDKHVNENPNVKKEKKVKRIPTIEERNKKKSSSEKKFRFKLHSNGTFYKLKYKALYIFSAYADFRLGHVVRMVGMAKHDDYEGLTCKISRNDGTETVKAALEYLPEGHNQKFDAIFVLCKSARPLSSDTKVGLSDPHNNKLDFLIPVQNIPSAPTSPGKGMTVCYPPLHNSYDNIEQFVENIEMNRILGFRHFFVYVHSVGPRVRRAIASYAKEGIVHVVSWEAFPLVSGSKYPVPKDYTIHYLGQMVAINDCLYRAMNRPFRVVAFHDFDELIFPHKGRSLSEVVAQDMGPSVAALSVRCAMFNLRFADTIPASKDSLRLLTQTKTKRLKNIFPHQDRSKMIVAADKVVTMGIHFVWKFFTGQAIQLNADVALLHHYRDWGKAEGVVDKTALKYGQVLKANAKSRLRQLDIQLFRRIA